MGPLHFRVRRTARTLVRKDDVERRFISIEGRVRCHILPGIIRLHLRNNAPRFRAPLSRQ